MKKSAFYRRKMENMSAHTDIPGYVTVGTLGRVYKIGSIFSEKHEEKIIN